MFPVSVCTVVYTPLHHTSVQPCPSAKCSSVFKEAGSSWFLACHRLSCITFLSDRSSSYLPMLRRETPLPLPQTTYLLFLRLFFSPCFPSLVLYKFLLLQTPLEVKIANLSVPVFAIFMVVLCHNLQVG